MKLRDDSVDAAEVERREANRRSREINLQKLLDFGGATETSA